MFEVFEAVQCFYHFAPLHSWSLSGWSSLFVPTFVLLLTYPGHPVSLFPLACFSKALLSEPVPSGAVAPYLSAPLTCLLL